MKNGTSADVPGPLAGVRVLDLSGPMGQPAGRSLADLGADVILVEPPSGSSARSLAPFAGGAPDTERSIFHLHFNTNKRGVVLDLTSKEGRRDLLRLVRTADAVIESFAPGYLTSLGLGYEVLEAQRPGLVLTSITPFGQDGPYHGFQGTDLICGAMGGQAYFEGPHDGPPVAQPRYQAYQLAGVHAGYGTLLALWHRRHARKGQDGGEGQQVDVSIQEVLAAQQFIFAHYASHQAIRERVGRLSWGNPYSFYPCSDGWVFLSVIMLHQWQAFAEWTQDPILIESPFEGHLPQAEASLIGDRIAEFSSTMTMQEFVAEGTRRRVPVAPVNNVPAFVEHEHTSARGFMQDMEHPVAGRYRAAGAPVIYSATPWRIRRPAPTLGQHTTQVLSDLSEMPANGAEPKQPVAKQRNGSERGTESPLPLEGIRVLDLTKAFAGPFGARFLADFGADVIRVESLLFPDYRALTKEPDLGYWYRSNAMYADVNRNKRSITLDLHTEGGRELLLRLAAECDIMVENFHYAALPKWGLDYDTLKQINPRLIMLSAPGFGSSGPARDYFSYGGCLLAFNGFSDLWSHPGADQREKSRAAHPDFVTAAQLALAAMAALHHRETTGEGQHIEVAQVESAAAMIGTAIMEYTLNGTTPQPWGNRDPNFAPQSLYPCLGHDRWCAISCQTDAHWIALRTVMGAPAWAHNARFDSVAGRMEHHDEIDAGVAEWTRGFTPHQVMLKCQAAEVPAGVVATGEDLYLDPHLRERDFVVEIDHPVPGRLEHPGVTVRLSRTPGGTRLPAPLTGEHNDEVFGQLLGLSPQERHAWEEAGALA